MLDWTNAPIHETTGTGKVIATVEQDDAVEALKKEHGDFTEASFAIRQSEIDFLDNLVVFQLYIDQKLIQKDDLMPLIFPTIRPFIPGYTKEEDPEFPIVCAIWTYIRDRDQFVDAQRLLVSMSLDGKTPMPECKCGKDTEKMKSGKHLKI